MPKDSSFLAPCARWNLHSPSPCPAQPICGKLFLSNGHLLNFAARISDPRPHHLLDQQFPGRHARGVYDSLHLYAESWATRGVRAWEEGWWDMAVAVGDKIAPLIGAQPGEISLHQNVTLTQASHLLVL